jgi:hypothetical protein
LPYHGRQDISEMHCHYVALITCAGHVWEEAWKRSAPFSEVPLFLSIGV